MRSKLTTWFAAALLTLPGVVHAGEADPFDAIDARLEAEFERVDRTLEEQYQLLDQALEDAYTRLSGEVASTWGESDVVLPTRKQWVDYAQDMQTRRIVDFEAGTVQIEQIVENTVDTERVASVIHDELEALRTDSEQDLAKKDLAMQYARESLEAAGVDTAPIAELPDEPVLERVIAPIAEDNLANTIAVAFQAKVPAPVNAPLAAEVVTAAEGKRKVSVTVPLANNFTQTLADRYFGAIAREARRRDLAPSLLLAVMETESSFNPRATSGIPAYGLMQLVPKSGALDAYLYVYGKRMLLDPEYLYDPDQNVELGSAYLALLQNRYLRHIDNPRSKELCAIAAYNTGASNVARSFVGTRSVPEAAKVINAMEPDAVYNHLRNNLPYEETRNYIRKVTAAQERYARYDTMSELES